MLLRRLLLLWGGASSGLAAYPPMGWRSWNCFGGAVSQDKMIATAEAMTRLRKGLDGETTSLLSLGFSNLGLDDGWQACGEGPRESFHDVSGGPIVNQDRFPNMAHMTADAHAKGLTVGFYANNCICPERASPSALGRSRALGVAHDQGDANALIEWGFDSVKVDACGPYLNMSRWSELLQGSGRPILLENCHWGLCESAGLGERVANGNSGCPERRPDGSVDCPFHYFRTSGDIDGSRYGWLRNLESAVRFLSRDAPLAGRGCWAFPDMLEVGNMDELEPWEWEQAHFGAWLIMSSPLVLGFDLRNDSLVSASWPFIANTEALAVSQSYAGHPGWRFAAWTPAGSRPIDYVPRPLDSGWCQYGEHRWPCPVYTAKEPLQLVQVWAKPMPAGRLALFVLNADAHHAHSYALRLDQLGMPSAVAVRDLWRRRERGGASKRLSGNVPRLSSELLLLSPLSRQLSSQP